MHPIIWPEFVGSGTYKSFIPDTHTNNEESFLTWYMHVGMHMTQYLVFYMLTKVGVRVCTHALAHMHPHPRACPQTHASMHTHARAHTQKMISSKCPSCEVDSTSNTGATRSLQTTHFLS